MRNVTGGVQVGDYEVRAGERRVLLRGEPLPLGARAMDLLLVLVDQAGQVVSKDRLMAQVWPGVVVEENNLTTQVSTLRRLMGAQAVVTVVGRGYQLGLPVRPLDDAPPAAASTPAAPLVSDQPTLAVLAFANLTGDPGQDYFVDGVVDDLTNALSRVRRFFVIARSSSFTYKGRAVDVTQIGRELGVRYVLDGSFQQAGARVRIGVQLIETGAGRQLWSQRFEGLREDIFSLQDDITAQAVAAIEPNLVLAEVERARSKPTENLQAYDLCLRGLPMMIHAASLAEVDRGVALLKQAIDVDPDYAYAKAVLAWGLALACSNLVISRERGESALAYAEQALQGHRDDPTTLALAAVSMARMGRRHDAALSALDRALALNPNSITALRSAGWARLYVGDFERALAHFERAMHLNPLDPELGFVLGGKAVASVQAGDYDAAVLLARRALIEMPSFTTSHIALAVALTAAGRADEVPQASADSLRLRYPSIGEFRAFAPWVDGPFSALQIETLRSLGVPD
jgi:TolB-like protein/Flp pilus assembly protein TadD